MTRDCTCGAVDVGEWAGIHSASCPAVKPCKNCDGVGWVCENHFDEPFGKDSCGAGAPCPVCNWDMAVAGTFDRGRTHGLEIARQITSGVDGLDDASKAIQEALKNPHYIPPQVGDYS